MPGKKFSGITTLAKLKARCKVDRKTGCWHYTGAVRKGQGGAKLWIWNAAKQKFEVMGGAKASATLAGKPIPPRGRAWMQCCNEECVSPDHVLTGTMAEWGAFYREHGLWKNSAARHAAVTAGARARAKLDLDKVRAIRAAETSIDEEAARWGVGRSQISRVRVGRAWRESNPFHGLGARNA